VCAAWDEAALAAPDLAVAGLTTVADFAVAADLVAGFGAGLTGADAETPPVACGFVAPLGT